MAIDTAKARKLIQAVLGEITQEDGSAATDRFPGLRQVDAKVREVEMILAEANAPSLLERVRQDEDFQANSRRVRLEALANYCSTAIRFFESGVVADKKRLFKAPDVTRLTGSVPNLDDVIRSRWLEAQRCQYAKAFLSAVIMMGSILEALLLARCMLSSGSAYRAKAAPKNKDGSARAIQDWTLNSYVDVAVELGWIKTDRGKFSHALRESRNIVHPYAQASTGADFDEHTCKTSWHVLNASVEDLLAST
jgi:hypothetical protein